MAIGLNFCLENAIKRVQANKKGLKMNVSHQLPIMIMVIHWEKIHKPQRNTLKLYQSVGNGLV
jgi:hypothetical protein